MISLNNTLSVDVLILIAIFKIVIYMIDYSFVNDFQTNSAKFFFELVSLSRDTKIFDEAKSIDFHESAISDILRKEDISSINISSTIDEINTAMSTTAVVIVTIDIKAVTIFLNHDD